MKLELKHLAPYLPYGLRLVPDNYRSIAGGHGYYHRELDIDALYRCSIEDLKPILRPMSDLEDKIYLQQIYELGHSIEYSNGTFFDEAGTYTDPFWLPQICFDVLLANHFDVFGLIDLGLAVDINTLSNA